MIASFTRFSVLPSLMPHEKGTVTLYLNSEILSTSKILKDCWANIGIDLNLKTFLIKPCKLRTSYVGNINFDAKCKMI